MSAPSNLDTFVAGLDPFEADAVMRALPEANLASDTTWLRSRAQLLAERTPKIRDGAHAQAALRDLGMLVASLARHTGDPKPPAFVQGALVRLGSLADEAPRETVYSYATRNPRGIRRRTFTDTPGEHLFIDHVSAATDELEAAIRKCTSLFTSKDRRGASLAAARALAHLQAFRTHLQTVRRVLTPRFFTESLRPYYPPLDICGRTYFAPGGAQMPLLVVDVMVCSRAATGELGSWYEQCVTDNTVYLPPHHRALIEKARCAPGLARRAVDQPHLQAAVLVLTDELMRFRLPHRQLARANMAIRAEGSLGSGGYTTDSLDRLLAVTECAQALLAPGSPR